MKASFSAVPRSQACFECSGTGEIEGAVIGIVGLNPEGGEPILIPCLVCHGLGVVIFSGKNASPSARVKPIRSALAARSNKPLGS